MRTDADDELMLPALRKYSLISYVPGALKTSVIDTGTGFFSISSSSVSATYPSTDLLSTRYAVTAVAVTGPGQRDRQNFGQLFVVLDNQYPHTFSLRPQRLLNLIVKMITHRARIFNRRQQFLQYFFNIYEMPI